MASVARVSAEGRVWSPLFGVDSDGERGVVDDGVAPAATEGGAFTVTWEAADDATDVDGECDNDVCSPTDDEGERDDLPALEEPESPCWRQDQALARLLKRARTI